MNLVNCCFEHCLQRQGIALRVSSLATWYSQMQISLSLLPENPIKFTQSIKLAEHIEEIHLPHFHTALWKCLCWISSVHNCRKNSGRGRSLPQPYALYDCSKGLLNSSYYMSSILTKAIWIWYWEATMPTGAFKQKYCVVWCQLEAT